MWQSAATRPHSDDVQQWCMFDGSQVIRSVIVAGFITSTAANATVVITTTTTCCAITAMTAVGWFTASAGVVWCRHW